MGRGGRPRALKVQWRDDPGVALRGKHRGSRVRMVNTTIHSHLAAPGCACKGNPQHPVSNCIWDPDPSVPWVSPWIVPLTFGCFLLLRCSNMWSCSWRCRRVRSSRSTGGLTRASSSRRPQTIWSVQCCSDAAGCIWFSMHLLCIVFSNDLSFHACCKFRGVERKTLAPHTCPPHIFWLTSDKWIIHELEALFGGWELHAVHQGESPETGAPAVLLPRHRGLESASQTRRYRAVHRSGSRWLGSGLRHPTNVQFVIKSHPLKHPKEHPGVRHWP